jgi:UDP-N-acetylglucosamine 2-epimerase (non-hydrolysing)
MKMVTLIGTRPEIIEMSRLIPLLDRNFDNTLIYTGQHYSAKMADVFFKDLEIRAPDHSLNIQSSEYHVLLKPITEKLKSIDHECVVVYGDTNSTLASSISAKPVLRKKLIHVEAGLRSFDRDMPEEFNRMLTDHMSDFLFTPTSYSRKLLKDEGLENGVFVVGNTIVDAIYYYIDQIERKTILDDLDLLEKDYFLITLHRQETVDDFERMKKIVSALCEIKHTFVFPVHPRTDKRLQEFGIELPQNVIKIEPLGYFEFLKLLKESSLVLTDSGGVQEEAVTLKRPCLTLRNFTERMETIRAGVNFLVGTEPEDIRNHVEMIQKNGDIRQKLETMKNPYGDGRASEMIVRILKERLT